jgi:cephalosporin hydroxylase
MSRELQADLQSLRQQIEFYLDQDEAPAAYEMLEAHRHLYKDVDMQLLYCEVLVRIGRYEKVQELARIILESNPANASAQHYLNLVASATDPPKTDGGNAKGREYYTSIPQPFLGRLQDAVHHYRYKGIQMVKSPFDIALYPLIIWDLKPRTIIEIGSKEGGSAIWFADQVRSFNLEAQIVSIDLLRVESVQDSCVTFLQGNGRHLGEVLTPQLLSSLPHPWLVIEDADHAEPTSYAVLKFFHSWLNKGDIIVVEDGIMSDLYPASFPNCSSGPHLALKRFLTEAGSAYLVESQYCDFFGYNVTWSSNGILRRISP